MLPINSPFKTQNFRTRKQHSDNKTVKLYLIRHGIAQEATNDTKDGERNLTKEGRQKTEKVAKRLLNLGLNFELIASSLLVRARQTAEILQTVGLNSQTKECAHLAPGGSLSSWFGEWLTPRKYPASAEIAIIGHEPCLSHWAETLVWGEAGDNLVLKKAGVIGIKPPETGSLLGRSQVFWLTPPKYLL